MTRRSGPAIAVVSRVKASDVSDHDALNAVAIFVVLLILGGLAWAGITGFDFSVEAWDEPAYFFVSVPLMCVGCLAAGAIHPRLWYLWGVAVVATQPLIVFVCSPLLCGPAPVGVSFWPFGVLVFAVLSGFCSLAAFIGQLLAGRAAGGH